MTDGSTGGLAFTNPKVQRLRRLLGHRSAREEESALVIEGPLLVAEAVAAGWDLEGQFLGPDAAPIDGAGPVHRLASDVAGRISDVRSPTGVFAIARRPGADAGEVLTDAEFVVVLDRIGDPGNLGTILRSAEAAGVDAVVLTPGSVDPDNPKVVRASAGARFHVPVVTAAPEAVRSAGMRLVGTSSHRGVPHTDADWTGRVALVAGSEARGLDERASIDEWVRIEHRGRAESLNVAMAMTVLCFEAARCRREPAEAGGGPAPIVWPP